MSGVLSRGSSRLSDPQHSLPTSQALGLAQIGLTTRSDDIGEVLGLLRGKGDQVPRLQVLNALWFNVRLPKPRQAGLEVTLLRHVKFHRPIRVPGGSAFSVFHGVLTGEMVREGALRALPGV